MEGGIMEVDERQGGEDAADEGCRRRWRTERQEWREETESPELYFVTRRDAKITVEVSTCL